MLVGKFRFKWSKSVSPGIVAVKVVTQLNGQTSIADVPPDTQEYLVDVPENTAVSYTVISTDVFGREAIASVHSFTVNSLVDLQPATGLGHELLYTYDTDATTTTPAPETTTTGEPVPPVNTLNKKR